MLHCFYFFDGELIAHDKKRVLTLTVRTFLCVLNSGVCLFAVLTERDRGKRFDLEFGFLQKLGLLACVPPEIGQVIGDDTADLADLQGYGADCRQVLLRGVCLKRQMLRGISYFSFGLHLLGGGDADDAEGDGEDAAHGVRQQEAGFQHSGLRALDAADGVEPVEA